jgi:hypothetical protein
MFNKIFDQEVKNSIIRRRNCATHAGGSGFIDALFRQVARVFKQVVAKHLRPGWFVQRGLLRDAPKIVVRKNAHCGKIQLPGQSPNDFRSNFAQAVLGGVIREDDAEKDCPLTAPILADFVPDVDHFRRESSYNFVDRRLNLGLLRDCGGLIHLNSQLTAPVAAVQTLSL